MGESASRGKSQARTSNSIIGSRITFGFLEQVWRGKYFSLWRNFQIIKKQRRFGINQNDWSWKSWKTLSANSVYEYWELKARLFQWLQSSRNSNKSWYTACNEGKVLEGRTILSALNRAALLWTQKDWESRSKQVCQWWFLDIASHLPFYQMDQMLSISSSGLRFWIISGIEFARKH